jgi:hypothetical protein
VSFIAAIVLGFGVVYTLRPADEEIPPKREDLDRLDAWNDADLDLLIEEGRRRIDLQVTQLTNNRTRAQIAFTTGIALIIALFVQLQKLLSSRGHDIKFGVFVGALVLVFLGTLGAMAVLVVRFTLIRPEPGHMVKWTYGARSKLAGKYAEVVGPNSQRLRSQLIAFWFACVLLMLGATIAGAIILNVRFNVRWPWPFS